MKYGSLSTKTSVVGTTPAFQEIRNFYIRKGEFFTDEENRASLRVAVLGQTVMKNLFENDDPIGEMIRIRKIPFKIIGVMEAKGVDINGVDQDDQIIIPINTALRRVFNLTYLNMIYVQARDSRSINAAIAEVTGLLCDRHHPARRASLLDPIEVLRASADLDKTASFTEKLNGVSVKTTFRPVRESVNIFRISSVDEPLIRSLYFG